MQGSGPRGLACTESRAQGAGFRAQGLGLHRKQAQGAGFRAQGLGLRREGAQGPGSTPHNPHTTLKTTAALHTSSYVMGDSRVPPPLPLNPEFPAPPNPHLKPQRHCPPPITPKPPP